MTAAGDEGRPFGIAATLARTAAEYGDDTALVHDGVTRNWREIEQRVARQATIVAELTKPGARVAILARNGPAYLEISFAVPWAGRVFVPINERLAPAEIEQLLDRCPCALLLFDDDFADIARTLARDRAMPCLHIGARRSSCDFAEDFEQLSHTAEASAPSMVAKDAVWAIVFTGGTTGAPKGVVLTHGAIEYDISTIAHHLDWGSQPKFLHVTPLFHLAGLGPSFVITLWGGTHHFLPRFSVSDFLAAMMRHGIEASALVPTMIAWLAAEEGATRAKLPHWRYCGYGASAIQEATLRRLLARLPGMQLTQFYGQTECCGNLTTLSPSDHDPGGAHSERLRSAGRPVIGAQVQIIRPDRSLCEPNEAGEIVGRSDGLFSGYHAHPELTAQTLVNGWLRTGDIGYRDEHGYLYVTDRLKDMIVTGGENVASSEVEQVIAAHEAVAQCAVIGVRDAQWGERIHAICVTHGGHTLDHEALAGFCKGKLARYKIPKTSTITNEPLPVSALGKIRKDILRAQAAATDT